MKRVSELTLLRLGFLFLILTVLSGHSWFTHVKSEADEQYEVFNALVKCTEPVNGCWNAAAFNMKLGAEEELFLAARRGFKAEMALPWPSPRRVGAYMGIIVKYKKIEDNMKTINLAPSTMT